MAQVYAMASLDGEKTKVVNRHHVVSHKFPTPNNIQLLGENIKAAYFEMQGNAIDQFNAEVS